MDGDWDEHVADAKRIAREVTTELTCVSVRIPGRSRLEKFVMRKIVLVAIAATLLSCRAYGQNAPSGTQSCEDLAQLELPGAKILSAQTVAAGAFTPPANLTPWLGGDPTFDHTLTAVSPSGAEEQPDRD